MTTTWTDVAKPLATSSIITTAYTGGVPIGLLLALTASSVVGVTSVVTSLWTDVAKGTGTWTNITKAT